MIISQLTDSVFQGAISSLGSESTELLERVLEDERVDQGV